VRVLQTYSVPYLQLPWALVAAVVLWLSRDFISKRYPMEELHLLLHWRQQGSKVALLPVLHDLTYQNLLSVTAEYKAAHASSSEEQVLRKQWGKDLEELGGITALRKDQVLRCTVLFTPHTQTVSELLKLFPNAVRIMADVTTGVRG
jgi:hypothetical protein